MAERERATLIGLARNPAASEDVLTRLARHAGTAREMSWRRQVLPDPVVVEILAHRDPRAVLHLNPRRVLPTMLARIAADSDPRHP